MIYRRPGPLERPIKCLKDGRNFHQDPYRCPAAERNAHFPDRVGLDDLARQ